MSEEAPELVKEESIGDSDSPKSRENDPKTKRKRKSTSNGDGVARRESSKRNRSKYTCIVQGCGRTDKGVNPETGEPLQFFEPPSDRKIRCKWEDALPELKFLLPSARFVCEVHFKDGKPSDEHPVPTLHLVAEPAPQVLRLPEEVKVAKKAAKMKANQEELLRANLLALLPQPEAKQPVAEEQVEKKPVEIKAKPQPGRIMAPGGRVIRIISSSAHDTATTQSVPSSLKAKIDEDGRLRLVSMPTKKEPTESRHSAEGEHVCERCTAEFPRIRASLGKLESRLDTMISMVKTIFHQQFGQFPRLPTTSFMEGFADPQPPPLLSIQKPLKISEKVIITKEPPPQLMKQEVEQGPEKPAKKAMGKHYLRNAIARCILAKSGDEIRLEDLSENGPIWIQRAPIEQIQETLNTLAEDGLVEEENGVYMRTSAETIKSDPDLIKSLESYGLSLEAYQKSFK